MCARARRRKGRGVWLSPSQLATALLGLGRISQLFKVHFEHLFRAGPVMALSVIWRHSESGQETTFLLHFPPLKSKKDNETQVIKKTEGVCVGGGAGMQPIAN